jgi:glutamine cyclotransferase
MVFLRIWMSRSRERGYNAKLTLLFYKYKFLKQKLCEIWGMGINKRFLWIILYASLASCGSGSDAAVSEPEQESTIPAPVSLGYAVMNSYPHDTAAFTQGLEFHKGKLMESTGLLGRSSLRKVDPKTGKVLSDLKLSKDVFAEGITIMNDTLYQLSWQNHEVYVYDVKGETSKINTLPWSGEGWGITHDSTQLIISDGSDKLYFVEPRTLKLKKVLSVRDQYGAVNNLNELEMVEGYIFANRWQYDYILKIDPNTGLVVATLGMKDFLKRNTKKDLSYLDIPGSTAQQSGAVLNGIAYDAEKKTLFITGKLWPEVFEIRIQ